MKRVSVSLLRETIVANHELGPLPQSLSAEQCPGRLLFTALAFYRPLRMSCRPRGSGPGLNSSPVADCPL